MQPGSDYTASYYNYNHHPPPHLQNPNPNPNPNPSDPFLQSHASAPPFSNYSSSDYTPSTYSSPYPHYSQNSDPVPPTAPSYNQPYPHLQQQTPYYPYDPSSLSANPNPNPNPNPDSVYSATYPHSYAPPSYENPSDGGEFGYPSSNSGRYGLGQTAPDLQTGFYEMGGRQLDQGRPHGGGFEEGVYAYDGGKDEPYGARGIGGFKSASSARFDDYGRSIGFEEEKVGSGKIVRASPKMEAQQDVKNGVQKFRVKLLPEGSGQTMDVLCQIGLDGIRMLDPNTNRTLRIYPLESVIRWEVTESSIYTFWAKSPVDIEPRRIRLQSNRYTTNTVLDIVAAASVQLKEMGGNRIQGPADSGKPSEQTTEKKKGFPDWINFIKPGNEEKDHWVPDEAVNKCIACGTDFGAFVRRHHCRNCGDIFCDKCTQGRTALTADEQAQPVRVCDRCLAEVSQRLDNAKETVSKSAVQQSHEDLARKLQEEMDRNRKGSSGSKSTDVSGRQMKEVACPTCTVHLQVQVPTSPTMDYRQKRQKKEEEEEETANEVYASCSFADLGLHPALCEQLRDRMGFEVPTLIQAQSIPIIILGRHVLINAATGTGKTIAYLTPIIHHLKMYNPRVQRSDGTFALVLVPTRELCMQVYEILQKLLHRFHWIVPGYIMGGENRSKEKARLRKGISILVATPGRLLDHLKNTSSFLYRSLRWIIFDEADRILEMGFGKEVEEILTLLGSRQSGSGGEDAVLRNSKFQRQNLLLSATLNDKVNHLAKISLENPVMIGLEESNSSSKLPCSPRNLFGSIGSKVSGEIKYSGSLASSLSEDYNLPAQLVQRYVKVPCGLRPVVLLSILRNLFEREVHQKIVVFFSTCDAVDFHYSLISEFQWSCDPQPEVNQKQTFVKCRAFRLHGNMEHDGRRATFQGFNTENSALLLCTDVAARGLDFPKVRYIIQYDSPGEASEYVHRVGRTARLGEKGDALLFLQPVEMDYLQDLQKHGALLEEFPLLKLLDSFPLYGQKHHNKNLLSLEMHPWVLTLQKAIESFILMGPSLKKLAKEAFRSWVRAYTAHRGDLKRIFVVKKLHLGHVARSFGLKEQPSLVGKSFKMQAKKRKRDHKQGRLSEKRLVTSRT